MGIKFRLKQTEDDKRASKLYGYQVASEVIIEANTSKIGQIFSPSGSGNDKNNAIQVCGFTEAFDLWGCGVFEGYKDIQLLFDGGVMGGKKTFDFDKCCRCYRHPCQCETTDKIPFTVKTSKKLKKRITTIKVR